jgi:hypothetical protein
MACCITEYYSSLPSGCSQDGHGDRVAAAPGTLMAVLSNAAVDRLAEKIAATGFKVQQSCLVGVLLDKRCS